MKRFSQGTMVRVQPMSLVTKSALAICMMVILLSFVSIKTQAQTASPIVTWTENAWIDTQGGTLIPDSSTMSSSAWKMTMARNDTEQMIIGLLNTSNSNQTVQVSLSPPADFTRGKADLMIMGAIESQKSTGVTPNNAALVNLFTPEQVTSFDGNFPATFVGEEVWKDFPMLTLKPNEPLRLWLRIRSYTGTTPGSNLTIAGNYRFLFRVASEQTGQALEKNIDVEVLPTWLPNKPYKEVLTYGGYDEVTDLANYTTVRGSETNYDQKKNYKYMNLLSWSRSGLWHRELETTENLYNTDRSEFSRQIRSAVDAYYARMYEEGWTDEQILISIFDEPFLRHVQAYIHIAEEVKAYRPNARIIANAGGEKSLEFFQALNPYVDIWVPHETTWRDKDVHDFLHSTAKPLWFYSNYYGENSRFEPGLLQWFRRAGWSAIAYDLDGMGMWSVNYGYKDWWNDFDDSANRNDAVLIFPSSAGPITTRGMEGWRESVEDVSIYERIRQAQNQGKFSGEWELQAKQWFDESPSLATSTFKTDPLKVIEIRNTAWNLLREANKSTSVSPVCDFVITKDAAPNTDFGLPYAPYSPAQETLLAATCDENTNELQLQYGSGKSTQFIYQQGYYWDGSAWQAFALQGNAIGGSWLSKQATAAIPGISGGTRFFVGYVCEYYESEWKCGCKDAACDQAYWQLQGVRQ